MRTSAPSYLQSVPNEPDTQAPGLTRFLPQGDRALIGHNPLGVYTPPPYADAGEFFFQEVLVGTARRKLDFPMHEHIIFQNQGLVTIQFSNDANTWFDFMPAGLILVFDMHRASSVYVRTGAGSAVLLATTW